jgi:hypothetical protein
MNADLERSIRHHTNAIIDDIAARHRHATPRPTQNPAWFKAHEDIGKLLTVIDTIKRQKVPKVVALDIHMETLSAIDGPTIYRISSFERLIAMGTFAEVNPVIEGLEHIARCLGIGIEKNF